MPIRNTALVNQEIYHIFNRGLNSTPIFSQKNDYQRFLDSFLYYQNYHPPYKFSFLKTLSTVRRNELLKKLRTSHNWQIEIITYCLMPNHFHFLLKQLKDQGITNFIRCLNDSYSHYFNLKYQRKGSLFEGRFKAVRVETDDQLIHLSRYIHLNPYSSFLVVKINQLSNYLYSSLNEYLGTTQEKICQKEIILDQFQSINKYKKFVFDQADYQKTLEQIKHQLFD